MSAANRQKTCAMCAKAFHENDSVELEPLIAGPIRYIAVHKGACSTYAGPANWARRMRREQDERTQINMHDVRGKGLGPGGMGG